MGDRLLNKIAANEDGSGHYGAHLSLSGIQHVVICSREKGKWALCNAALGKTKWVSNWIGVCFVMVHTYASVSVPLHIFLLMC